MIVGKTNKHHKILEYSHIFFYYLESEEVPMLKERVEGVLDKVRIGLQKEGGDIELVDIRDTVVYVRLTGACGTCPMSMLTMKNWVESSIKKEISEVTSVQAV